MKSSTNTNGQCRRCGQTRTRRRWRVNPLNRDSVTAHLSHCRVVLLYRLVFRPASTAPSAFTISVAHDTSSPRRDRASQIRRKLRDVVLSSHLSRAAASASFSATLAACSSRASTASSSTPVIRLTCCDPPLDRVAHNRNQLMASRVRRLA